MLDCRFITIQLYLLSSLFFFPQHSALNFRFASVASGRTSARLKEDVPTHRPTHTISHILVTLRHETLAKNMAHGLQRHT